MKNSILKTENFGTILITSDSINNNSDIDIARDKSGLQINFPEDYNGKIKLDFDLSKEINEKTFITLGKNSHVDLSEERINGNSNYSSDIEIVLHENSKLNNLEIQNLNNNLTNIINKKIICGKGSAFSRIMMCFGSKTNKSNININLSESSEAEDIELFFGNESQEFELNTNLIHSENKSKGNVIIKGILIDKAKCNSNGILKIKKEGQKTNTSLSEHILLLSKDAKAQAIPALEIEADDVLASHSASVTQIDGDQLFYLTTRGITENEAKQIIASGFLQNALDKINNEQIKKIFVSIFEEKWKQAN